MDILLRIVVGAIAGILGYALGRRVLDALGLEERFQRDIWRTTISQFGELLLAVLMIFFVLLAGLIVVFIQEMLGLRS